MLARLHTIGRNSLVGWSAMASITAAVTIALLLGTARPAYAITDGDVIRHDSIQSLVIAKDIRDRNAGYGGNCHIWNWNGGSRVHHVNPGGNCWTASMNGRTYSWTVYSDTDAFTLQYEPYWVKMRDGTWHRVAANVYTKIQDHENAHCYRESDGVNCYISLG